MTMLGNLFIELGYLGPFEKMQLCHPKIWPPNTALKSLFAIFLEHPVYIYRATSPVDICTGEVAG